MCCKIQLFAREGHLRTVLTFIVLLSRPSRISGILRIVSDIRESPRCQSTPILKRHPTFAPLVLPYAVRLHVRPSVINHLHSRHCNRGATMVSRWVHVPYFHSVWTLCDSLRIHYLHFCTLTARRFCICGGYARSNVCAERTDFLSEYTFLKNSSSNWIDKASSSKHSTLRPNCKVLLTPPHLRSTCSFPLETSSERCLSDSMSMSLTAGITSTSLTAGLSTLTADRFFICASKSASILDSSSG